MAEQEIHVTDHGTRFDLTFQDEDGEPINLAPATTLIARFQRPDRTSVDKVPEIEDADAGLAYYIALPGDLSQVGSWRLQGYVVTPAGAWYSDIQRFRVHANLPAPAA